MAMEDEMKIYYREIFPLEDLYRILEISETREVAFFIHQNTYIRFLTFSTVEALREKIVQLNPKKIDVGAIYNIRPTKTNGAVPVAKELVFDIDLTDYPRSCCQEKTVCRECYQKIKCAIRLLDFILENEFGFRSYGFVFSGRRGVHCWVFDHKEMSSSNRNDIYKYFQSIIDKNMYVKEYNNIMEEFGTKNLVQEWFVRIDKQVTVGMSHLIKVPFSIHPETGNVSVPLDPQKIPELEEIPTLRQVIEDPKILEPFVAVMGRWRNDE